MATPTYTLIDSVTLGSSASSVTFSSLDTIAAGYRDLVVVMHSKVTASGDEVSIRFNGSSSSDYYGVRMTGNGSSTSSGTQSGTALQFNMTTITNSAKVLLSVNMMDFSQTNKHKSVLSRYNRSNGGVEAWAQKWSSLSAMTSITLFCGSAFAVGGTFFLYGIEA